MRFILAFQYTGIYTGRSTKKTADKLFHRALERKVMKNISLSFSSLILVNLIKNGIVRFLFAILAYVHNTL